MKIIGYVDCRPVQVEADDVEYAMLLFPEKIDWDARVKVIAQLRKDGMGSVGYCCDVAHLAEGRLK